MRIPIAMFAIAAIALATAWDCVLAADNNGVVPIYPQDPLPLQGRTSDNGNKTSTLSLPLRISLSDLNSRLNTFVPYSFQGDAPINIPGANSGSHATFTVTRDGIVLSPSANGGIAFTTNVKVNGAAHYAFLPVPHIHFGPLHLEPIHNHTRFSGAATVSGQINPTILGNWHIQPHLQAHVDVHQATLTLFHMSVRDFATRKITAALPGLAAKAASDLNSSIGLRDKLARYWGAAFMTVLLSEEPETFAQFTPRDLKLVQPHVTGDGFLEASVEIDCGLRIAVGERPDDQVPTALPTPTFVPSVDDLFQVYVPVSISLTVIASKLERGVSGKSLDLGDGLAITMNGVTVGADKTLLLVRANVEASNAASQSHLKGEVTFQGVPVITDNGSKVSLAKMDYTVASRSELLKIGAWLLRPVILDRLKTELQWDLDNETTAANDYVNQELSAHLSSKELTPSIDIHSLKADRILLAGDKLTVGFLVKGTCELNCSL
jgi:Domain of unknown function (DUF4403)